MPEKKLVIDVEIKKRTTSSQSRGTDYDDPKIRLEREKQAAKESLENLKHNNKQKQAVLQDDIKTQYALLRHAKSMEMEAERQGNREKIKEMIAYRKLMESQLRVMEADMRLLRSKDLVDFKANLKEKEKAQREYDRNIRNAPRTRLRGDVGSQSYLRQMEGALSGMLPGSDEFVKTEAIINRYRGQLTAAGVDVRSLSQKMGGELTNALNLTAKSFVASGFAAAGAGVSIMGLWNAMQKGVQLLELQANFEGTAKQLNYLRESTNNAVSEASLIKLSNQASDLSISLEDQVVLFALAERSGDRYGTSVEENMRKAINVTEGMTKGVKELGIEKAKYEKILIDLVKMQGGEIEIIAEEGKEREINIKKLDPEIQKRLRLQALIQASGITYNEALNQQTSWNDKLQETIVGLDDLISYLGIGLTAIINFATPIGPLAAGIRDLRKTIAELPGEIENFDRAILSLINDIPLIGSALKDTFETIGQFIGILSQADDALREFGKSQTSSIESVIKGWTGTYEQGVNQLMALKQISRQEAEALLKPYVHFAKENEAEGSNIFKNTGTSRGTGTSGNIETKKLNFLEEYRKKVEETKETIASLLLLLSESNLLDYEKIAINNELIKQQEELNKLYGISIAKGFSAERQESKTAVSTPRGMSIPTANQQGSSDDEYFKRLREIQDNIGRESVSAFTQSLSLAQMIDDVLGGGASEVIQAFQTAYTITQAIVELINTIETITSLLDFIPGIGAIGAIPGLAGGGRTIAGAMYEWNENGKELFIPTTSGYVLDAKRFNEFSTSVSAMASVMDRDRNYVGTGFAQSAGSTVINKIIIKNPIDYKKAFEVTAAEQATLYNGTAG